MLSGFQIPEWCRFSPGFCEEMTEGDAARDDYYVEALVAASLMPSIGAQVGMSL